MKVSSVFFILLKMDFKISNYSKDKILFVFALESEAGNFFNDYQVIFTGIGKINATLAVTQAIEKLKPELIINLGTAGSNVFSKYSIINCSQFIQRDMDVRGLGFELYKTPLNNVPIIFEYGEKLAPIQHGICGTGDSFETKLNDKPYNVVDMEAYSLAFVAKTYNIPFLCLKFISDGADDSAAENWKENIVHSAEAFYNTLFS